MPLFDMRCPACGRTEKDIFMKYQNSDKSHRCQCGAEMVKEISAGNFILKGSGWERDGYASKQ